MRYYKYVDLNTLISLVCTESESRGIEITETEYNTILSNIKQLGENQCIGADGNIRDLTDIELLKKQSAEQMLKLAEAEHMTLSAEELMAMYLPTITITLPNGQTETADKLVDTTIDLPFKVGYKWVLEGTAFVLKPDEDAIGTADNPIIYKGEVPLIPNAFYLKNGKLYVYMNEQFVPW